MDFQSIALPTELPDLNEILILKRATWLADLVLDAWDSFQEGRILTEQGFGCQSNLTHFLDSVKNFLLDARCSDWY